jgi:hypothetical protein
MTMIHSVSWLCFLPKLPFGLGCPPSCGPIADTVERKEHLAMHDLDRRLHVHVDEGTSMEKLWQRSSAYLLASIYPVTSAFVELCLREIVARAVFE